MIFFPNCKINLGLHILRKRIDGFHDIETILYPLAIRDALEIIQDDSINDVWFRSSGLPLNIGDENNICKKAYDLLKKDFPLLPVVKMHLHKVIPSGAGLGGGSSNGAATLQLLNQQFQMGLAEDQLLTYAAQLGSDCPFFIKNKPCVATGRGEILNEIELDLSSYTMIIVNPGIHISTVQAFSEIIPDDSQELMKDAIKLPLRTWKNSLTNDFEKPIFNQYPEIAKVKEQLYLAGALYASMSGSGSSLFGIFKKDVKPVFYFPGHYFIKII